MCVVFFHFNFISPFFSTFLLLICNYFVIFHHNANIIFLQIIPQKKMKSFRKETEKNIMDLMRKYTTLLHPLYLPMSCRFDMLLLLKEKKGRFFRFDGAKMIPWIYLLVITIVFILSISMDFSSIENMLMIVFFHT